MSGKTKRKIETYSSGVARGERGGGGPPRAERIRAAFFDGVIIYFSLCFATKNLYIY